MGNFQFFVIPETGNISSSSGSIHANQFNAFGSFSRKELNPGSLIEGLLLKKGLSRVPQASPAIQNRTLLVNYGQSGRRNVGIFGAYTLEVTIKLLKATTLEPVFFCTAEGMGSTEADDIRVAITRCLKGF